MRKKRNILRKLFYSCNHDEERVYSNIAYLINKSSSKCTNHFKFDKQSDESIRIPILSAKSKLLNKSEINCDSQTTNHT